MSCSEWKETSIGKVPNHWDIYTVNELVKKKILDKPLDGNHGAIHPTQKDFVDKGIPFIMASDIKNNNIDYDTCKFITEEQSKNLKKGFAKEGDVLLTHKATIGRTCVVKNLDTPYIILTPQVTYYRILDNTKLNNEFLKYYFMYDRFRELLSNWSKSGSTRAYIGITAQGKLPIVIPPIKEQEKIVNILSSLDNKIELNKDMNKTLEEIAQSIFKRWFIDFEFPNEYEEPYKSNAGEMVESELGMIPKGWKVKTIGDMGSVITGKTPSSKDDGSFGDKLNFITPRDINNSIFMLSTERKLSDKGIQKLNKNIVPKNSIGVSCIGSNLGEVYITGQDSITNQQINTLVLNKKELFPYIYIYLKNMKKDFLNIAGGSAVPIINKTTFSSINILVPEENLLNRYINITTYYYDKIKNNLKEIETLEILKQILLPRLMNGEI